MTTGETQSVDFVALGKQLEQQEIEAAGGVATPQIYGQLLAIYLLQNDLPNSKFLWKRIPAPVKNSNAELGNIWAISQKQWNRDFPGTYETLNKDWSDTVKPIMAAVLEATRKRAFHLVAQAYSSIGADDFASLVGLPMIEAVEAAVSRGWQADPHTHMVMPNKPDGSADPTIPNEQQLARLTDFVSFLEN